MEQLILSRFIDDEQVIIGPGVGLDCAVVRPDPGLIVITSDPVTFASDNIGWYVVQVNANDIVTTGAIPRWFMATILLPDDHATPEMAERIFGQIRTACEELQIILIGGHTEVTYGLSRPIVTGTMLGTVSSRELLSPKNVEPGDWILLTKSIPIEAAAVLAKELPARLLEVLTPGEIERAASYLHNPGISVVGDARVALSAGRVTSMHDPTEGGLASALWELAQASGRTLCFDQEAVPLDKLALRICRVFDLNPLATIASGSLLMTVAAEDGEHVCTALMDAKIPCAHIGVVQPGPPRVIISGKKQETGGGTFPCDDSLLLPWPERDEIGKVFLLTGDR
jgi:hydrogenase maturation factor